LFKATDFNTMKNNVDQAVGILTARKDKGLFLDANVSAVLGTEDKQEQEPEPTAESNDVVSTTLVITGSVGRWEKGARNLQVDVETVQRLLETVAQKLQAPELDPKGVDGKIGRQSAKSNTVAAIEAFQNRSNISITGLIEPDSQTLQALLEGAGET